MADNGHSVDVDLAMKGAATLQAGLCRCLHKNGHLVVTVFLEVRLESWDEIARACEHSDVCVLVQDEPEEADDLASDLVEELDIIGYALKKMDKK